GVGGPRRARPLRRGDDRDQGRDRRGRRWRVLGRGLAPAPRPPHRSGDHGGRVGPALLARAGRVPRSDRASRQVLATRGPHRRRARGPQPRVLVPARRGLRRRPRMSNETPLLAEHIALGATLTDFAGWQMPLRYTSDIAEHHAVRQAAGLFDLSHMGEIAVVGPGAARALDHALVGNLSALAVGRARYSMLCQPDGAVIDDVVVYRLAPERFVVVANASNAAVALTELTE